MTLFPLFGVSLAAPVSRARQESENIWFNNSGMVLDHNLDTYVVGFGVTLQPAGVRCDASNFNFPSPEFKCGDSGYSFSLEKVPEFYSRYVIHISHVLGSGNVLVGHITFGAVGPLPWIRDQFGTANGTLVSAHW